MADNANKTFSAVVGGVKIEAPSQEALDRLVSAAFAAARPSAPPPPSTPRQTPAQPAAAQPAAPPVMKLDAFLSELQGSGGLRAALKAGLGVDVLEQFEQQRQLIAAVNTGLLHDRIANVAQRMGFKADRKTIGLLANTVAESGGDYSLDGFSAAAQQAIDNGWLQVDKPKPAAKAQEPAPQFPGAAEGGNEGTGAKGPEALDGTIDVDVEGDPVKLMEEAFARGDFEAVDAVTSKLMEAGRRAGIG